MAPAQAPTPPPGLTMRLSVKEAARILGVAQTTVHGMVDRGEIQAVKMDGRLWLDAASVAAAPRRKRGHPKEIDPQLCKRVQTARATEAEHEKWFQAATVQGLSVGDWLRKIANENS